MITSTDSSCILCLDFDGVTHPEPCQTDKLFCHLDRIEIVLRDFPSVEIVISSSWREEFGLGDLRAYFSPDIARRVVDVTPSIKQPSSTWLPGQDASFAREWECNSWKRLNRAWGTPWLAIDDRAHWFGPDCANLLLTNARTGFTVEDQITLRTMLYERVVAG